MINDTMFVGATIGETSHYWLDGMEEVHVYSWNGQEIVKTQVGYYGADRRNLCGCNWKVDATKETMIAVRNWLLPQAEEAYRKAVEEEKLRIRKGRKAEVVKGKKVPKGTVVEVFWTGERETYLSKQYHWMHETEEIAGCYDEQGNKLWIKTEYLKNLSEVEEPTEEEHKAWIAGDVKRRLRNYGCALTER